MDSEAYGPMVGGGAFNNYGGQAYMDYLDNPQNYTTNRPNEAADAAFSRAKTHGVKSAGSYKSYTNYYKLPEPPKPVAAAPTPAPTPEPKPEPEIKPTGPVEYSPEIQQAKERTNKYQSDIKDGTTSNQIHNPQDYSKDSYINRDSAVSNKYDFSAKAFGSASQDFLNKKKDEVTDSPNFTSV